MTDPTSRALALLGFLESRPTWTSTELATRLGVTERTVRRDVERLRNLGYVVESDAGRGGGYALGRSQVVPPLLLDEDQAVAVTLALMRAAQSGLGIEAESALRALATIDAVIPAALRERLAALRTSAHVAFPDNPLGGEVLLPCADAIRRRVRLRFSYSDRHGVETFRHVEPHQLVARRRRWLLVAFDLDRDDWRSFRIDRLTEPQPTTWAFTLRDTLADALARLDEPVPATAWHHEVCVDLHAPYDVVARTLPPRAGHIRALGEHSTEFVTGADDPAEAARWLARLDYDFTVIGDDDVRAAVAALAARLTASSAPPPAA